MGEFSPPFSEPLLSFYFFFLIPRLWFYYIFTKIHPPFQNPGSAAVIALAVRIYILITKVDKLFSFFIWLR